MGQQSSQQVWTDLDCIELKNAREAVNVDIYSFARQHSLSNEQLLELEEGGNSFFYTEAIKYNVGRKLLNSLGRKTEYQRLSEIAKAHSNIEAEVVQATLADSTAQIQNQSTANLSTANKIYILATALIVVLISYAFVAYPNKSNKTQEPSQALVVSQVSASATSVTSANTESINKTAEKNGGGIQESSATKASASANPTNLNECRWTDNAVELSAPTATKEGNYVYLIATKELIACVKDKSNKQTIVNLKPNQSQNISGTAPLKIYSSDLSSLNIFYQGSKVQPPSQNITEISLVELPLR